MRHLSVLLVMVSFAASGISQELPTEVSADCGALQITGTFSDIHFDEERERLVGAEIRIVVTEDGYQASLQIANGRLSNLYVAEVELNVDLPHWPLGVPLPEREPNTDSVQMIVAEGPYAGYPARAPRQRLLGLIGRSPSTGAFACCPGKCQSSEQ
jgi:hypothetical protein